ncbi:HD domain-containing protein [Streptomyces californicus]
MAETEQEQAKGAAGFLLEMGMLKRAKRSGWWIAGVKDPETIAEHSLGSHSSAPYSP